jgi:hypothetical protein
MGIMKQVDREYARALSRYFLGYWAVYSVDMLRSLAPRNPIYYVSAIQVRF